MQTTTTLWEEIIADPRFQDLPYKVETTETGKIVLSPHKLWHALAQGEIMDLLRDHLTKPGRRAVEFAVETPKGVKAPDVVWISDERLAQIPEDAAASPIMPEIAIEVVSKGNTSAEMDEKRQLYIDGGALEVWIVSERGEITFYDPEGRIDASRLAPGIPSRLG